MKAVTLLILGFTLVLASVVAPSFLGVGSGTAVLQLVTRVSGVICILIGFVRLARRN